MDVASIHPLEESDLRPAEETQSARLKGPMLLVQWLVVGLAAVLWVVLVPLIELVRELFRPGSSATRRQSGRASRVHR